MDRKDYEEAVMVQDACNLCGVVRSFSRVLLKLNDEMREKGLSTDWVNQHPISKAYADKIIDLSKGRGDAAFDALSICIHSAKFGESNLG